MAVTGRAAAGLPADRRGSEKRATTPRKRPLLLHTTEILISALNFTAIKHRFNTFTYTSSVHLAVPFTRHGSLHLMLWLSVISCLWVSAVCARLASPRLQPSLKVAQRTWERTHDIEQAIRDGGASGRTARRWRQTLKERGTLEPRPKSGRPPALSGVGAAAAVQLLCNGEHGGAHGVAAELKRQGLSSTVLHRTTVGRIAKKDAARQGHKLVVETGRPKRGVAPTTKHKRIDFAKAHLNWQWRNTMCTDRSKFYHRYPGQRVHRVRYHFEGDPPSVQTPNNPRPCNVYQGITPYGVTQPITVTGTWGERHDYKTMQGNQAQNITKAEYNTKVLPALLAEGNRIFGGQGISHWWLLQDNDPAHGDADTIIKEFNSKHYTHVNLMEDWPPSSPDLNPIENVWAWVNTRIEEEGCENFAAFKQAVIRACKSVPARMLKNLYTSMPKRMAAVLECKGKKTGY